MCAVLLCAACPARAATTIRVPLANGFDLPVGKPDGEGYYVFRGYYPGGHLGEDWNGKGGGDTDLGAPVYASGDGVVVFSEDYLRGWGNVVIVRHAYVDENGRVALMDSLYGHLDRRMVNKYQLVKRGQQLGTIGTAHGKYAAHLHFEMRKNIQIGMARRAFDQGYSNYFSPRQFIASRRVLRAGANVAVPVDTFSAPLDSDPAGSDGPPKPPALTRDGRPAIPPVPTRSPATVPVPEPGSVEKTDSKTKGGDANSKAMADREARLRKIIEENKKKVDAIKDDDLDGFWSKLKKKLDEKR